MSQQFWKSNTSMAKSYDKLPGPIARLPILPAMELIYRSGVLSAEGPVRILDNASGPAVITELLYNELSDIQKGDGFKILCANVGQAMVDRAREKIKDNGWQGVSARVINQEDLSSLKNEEFTHILTGLGINFCKDADAVLQAMNRILVPGGINAFSTWETVGWLKYVQQAFKRIPGAPLFPNQNDGFAQIQHGNRWEDREWLKQTVSKHFAEVEIYSLPKVHKVSSEQFVQTFGGPMVQGMLSLFWSEEDKEKYGKELPDALQSMFEEQKIATIDLQMDALITVAKKARA